RPLRHQRPRHRRRPALDIAKPRHGTLRAARAAASHVRRQRGAARRRGAAARRLRRSGDPGVTTALIADDEPLLREALARQLAQVWPELQIVAEARNGREAIKRFDEEKPEVCFLDIQMPGLTGIDVAAHIGRRAHIVFVTAFDDYAVKAFEQGALDYLLKPVE